MMVSRVYSEQLDLISLMAELRMELSNSSENRLRKESSAKVVMRSIEETPVIFLDVVVSTVRKNLMNRKLSSFPIDPDTPPATYFADASFLAQVMWSN